MCHCVSNYSNVCQDGLVCCCTVEVVNVPLWQISLLILLGKDLIPTLRLWMCSIMPQQVGLIDVVLSILLLHTTSHLYHLSSTAQQQVCLSSQTISTVHITTHDRHKLSRPLRLTAYSNVPWCTAWLPVEISGKAADPAHRFVQCSAKFLCGAIGLGMHSDILNEWMFCYPTRRLKLAFFVSKLH